VSRYRHVSAMKAEGSPSNWLARSTRPSEAEWDEAIVVKEMWDIHHGHDDTYNAVRLHSSLGNVAPIEWEPRCIHRDLLAA